MRPTHLKIQNQENLAFLYNKKIKVKNQILPHVIRDH